MFVNSMRKPAEESNRKQKKSEVHEFVHEQTSERMASRLKANKG